MKAINITDSNYTENLVVISFIYIIQRSESRFKCALGAVQLVRTPLMRHWVCNSAG